MNHQESEIQRQCVALFRSQYPQYAMLLIHPINEGSGHAAIDRRRQGIHKAEGAVAGVVDLQLFMPADYKVDYNNGGITSVVSYSGLGMELKTKKGRQSQQQQDFQKMYEAAGYRYVIIRTFEEFRHIVNDYIAHVPEVLRRRIAGAHVQVTRDAEERERAYFHKMINKK